MRAVIFDPDAPANLRLADVAEPVPADSEALVEVRSAALNFGEVHFIERNRKPGEVPGWDTAGVVVHPAADGSGPPVGSRVGWRGSWDRISEAAEALLNRQIAGKAVLGVVGQG